MALTNTDKVTVGPRPDKASDLSRQVRRLLAPSLRLYHHRSNETSLLLPPLLAAADVDSKMRASARVYFTE